MGVSGGMGRSAIFLGAIRQPAGTRRAKHASQRAKRSGRIGPVLARFRQSPFAPRKATVGQAVWRPHGVGVSGNESHTVRSVVNWVKVEGFSDFGEPSRVSGRVSRRQNPAAYAARLAKLRASPRKGYAWRRR